MRKEVILELREVKSKVGSFPPACHLLNVLSMSELGHVWTAPGWQGFSSRFAALVGAAMCPAF
jgi:hypothetical protein